MAKEQNSHDTLKQRIYTIIFGTGTPAGKLFDIVLIYAILASVIIVIIDSVALESAQWQPTFTWLEWIFTIFFTIEYAVRVYVSPNRWRYIFSFYGLVDLLSILPSYIGLFFNDISYLLIIRVLRVLRIFRVLKLVRYLSEANVLSRSILMSRRKIFVFFTVVLVLATIFGCLMFIVEGPENGFTSIPRSIYWTIVTITTVGYGDITPHTVLGQVISTLVMLTGYSIIAVPTGIFTAEIAQEMQRQRDARSCENCGRGSHEQSAKYCRFCGTELPDLFKADE